MTDFSELHDDLRTVARSVLRTDSPEQATDWASIVEAGWTGLEVPEQFGGAEATFAETAVMLEEFGRAAASASLLGTALAVGVVTALPSGAARDQLLADVADGQSAAVAMGFDHDLKTASGRVRFVADAADVAHLLLVSDDAVALVTGATVTPTPVVDQTRALALVDADGATVVEHWLSPGVATRVAQRAAVAVACDSLGVAEAMLAKTVEYASVRNQFGRPIGSFQAVKHACADMLVGIRVARQLVNVAVAQLVLAAGDGGDAGNAETAASVAMAKSHATTMAVDVAGKAMQLHGGIGYTWESGVHVYLKRATLNRSLFGSPAEHRRTLAMRYG